MVLYQSAQNVNTENTEATYLQRFAAKVNAPADAADFECYNETYSDWVHAELAKFKRGEPSHVYQEGNVTWILAQEPPRSRTDIETVELTVFQNIGKPLSKEISLAADGSINVVPAGKMSKGKAWRTKINDVEELAILINNLKSNQAITLGALREDLADKVEVTTKKKLNGNGCIARDQDHIVYHKNKPALVLADFDRKGMPVEIKINDFWKTLCEVLPALRNAAHVLRRSTSAGLYHDDKPLPFSGGWHVFVVAEDGEDSKRFLDTLHDRCWLAGYGWFYISKDGRLLERSIIDRSVYAPERLVFEGPPIVKPPLRQDAELRRPSFSHGDIINTHSVCPLLSTKEQKNVEQLKSDIKEKMQPEADRVRAAYIEARAEKMAERGEVTIEEARIKIKALCERQVLPPEWVLEFDDDRGTRTVEEVLDNPFFYHDHALADPIEGVEYGTSTAKVFVVNKKPWINSFAHGGIVYSLSREPEDNEPAEKPADADSSGKESPQTPENEKRICEALLSFHPVYGSDPWIKTCSGLKAYFGDEEGLAYANDWSSRQCKGYTNFEDLKARFEAVPKGDIDWLLEQPKKPEKALPRLEYLTLKDLRQVLLEHVAWIVPGFILAEAVNGLFGAGAVGKDLLLFQLAEALVSTGKWLGIEVPTTWNGEPIRVLWFPVEDPKKELRRRQHSIETHYAQQAKHHGETYVSRDDNLRIIPKKKGDGTVIAVYDREAGMVKPTERYAQICAEIEDFKPHVVIVGNRVNIFSVNQNDDAQARQCMELLDDLCETYHVTVIMPAHPSQGGQSSGSGESGTVQWNNACRGRCYLSKIKASGNDSDPDPDVRQLEVMKNNWGASGKIISMRWTKVLDDKGDWYGGVFVEDQEVVQIAVKDESGVTKSDAQIKLEGEEKIDADFMHWFDKAIGMGFTLSPKKKAENNPAAKFAEIPGCPYRNKKERHLLHAAMMRLLAKGVLKIDTDGPPSRLNTKLVRTGVRLVTKDGEVVE